MELRHSEDSASSLLTIPRSLGTSSDKESEEQPEKTGLDLYVLCSAHCNPRTKSPPGQALVHWICFPRLSDLLSLQSLYDRKLTSGDLVGAEAEGKGTPRPAQRLAGPGYFIIK